MRSRLLAVGALVLLLHGCSGGGGRGGPRTLAASVLARHAIAYSGYRADQSPDTQTYPSEQQIQEDLQLLVRGGWTLIRLFDCSPHAERVLRVIKNGGLDIKVMSGVWLSGAKAAHEQENRQQI